MARQQYTFSMRGSRHNMGGARQYSFQWERLVILGLVVALIVTLCVCLPSMGYRGEARDLIVARMQTECDTALSYSKYLSRTASSNSNAQLAVIRSSIYTMDVLNQTYAALEGDGSFLVDQTVFSGLYNILDNYFNQLTIGMNTSEQLTELSNGLEYLRSLVGAL